VGAGVEALRRASSTAARAKAGAARLLNSPWAQPAVTRAARLNARLSTLRSALQAQGQAAEDQARALALTGLGELTSRFYARLASTAQIREVVLEQGESIAAEWTEALQERAHAADERVERWLHRLHLRQGTAP
jgi:hypothetical protein